ncbi:MAG: hypothetical protein WBF34_07475 [Streptosporangiaceae bacterium]
MARYAADESARQRALAAAKAEYDRSVIAERTRAARLNAQVAERQKGFAAGIPEAVEWFVSRVLERSRYPQGFPHTFQVAYRPENGDVVVEFELPPQKVVPPLRGYKYVKTRDAIDPLARPETEVKQRYKLLIARVALRTLHEIFSATPSEVVEAGVFNGRISTIDRATGKPARPHLVSVSAERSVFQDLVLAAVEPAACLVRLNALVSPNPFDLEAVEPFIEFDLRRFRFMDDLDVVSGLDGRKNLLKLTPTEFEHLVKDLFVGMGAEANGIALGDLPWAEQVELDSAGDAGDAGLAGLAGGEVPGFLGFPRAGPVRAVAGEEAGHEDLQQECGQGEVGPVRGKKPRSCLSRRPGRAGS